MFSCFLLHLRYPHLLHPRYIAGKLDVISHREKSHLQFSTLTPKIQKSNLQWTWYCLFRPSFERPDFDIPPRSGTPCLAVLSQSPHAIRVSPTGAKKRNKVITSVSPFLSSDASVICHPARRLCHVDSGRNGSREASQDGRKGPSLSSFGCLYDFVCHDSYRSKYGVSREATHTVTVE